MTTQTTNLLIHIRAKDGDDYPVEAVLDDGSRFTGGRFQPDMDALRDAALDPQEYGETLFYALFDGSIRRAYDRALGRAGDGVLQIRLWIDQEAASLHALAWERMHHVHQGMTGPLATSAKTPFSRYFSLEEGHVAPISERPVRMVAVLANPTGLKKEYGLQPIDVTEELGTLVKALGDFSRADRLNVTLLTGRTPLSEKAQAHLDGTDWEVVRDDATLDNILRALDTDGGAHVLHVVAHGHFKADDAVASLFLENEEGGVQRTPDDDIAGRLQDAASRPHLVFLASCQSAKRDAANRNPFVGLAPKLVRAGVPAVVAMQDIVPVPTARELTRDFYRHLLDHGEVDQALNQGRLLLYERESSAWSVPVLFTHLQDGRLLVADPVQTALGAMMSDPQFDPLPEGQDYIPMDVVHLSGDLEAVDLDRLCRERTPGQEIVRAFDTVFSKERDTFVALIGDAGMGKSLQLRRLGFITAKTSSGPDAARVVVPVYIDLQELREDPFVGPADVEKLIVNALKGFWPEEGTPRPTDLVTASDGPILRVLVDGSDALPDHLRHRIWTALDSFARRRPQHQYVVACTSFYFVPKQLPFTDALVMQRLSSRAIAHYLTGRPEAPEARRLYGAIERAGLHDLAALPWLLVKMLKQTRQGALPSSRADVLRHYVEDAILEIGADPNMRIRAHHTLDALAWRMQSTFRNRLSIDEAFEIMAEVRGYRSYDLEGLLTKLLTHKVLVPVGVESLAFARDAVRAYGCARYMARQETCASLLDDVLATLGRRSRYRWWEDTLVLLAGLGDISASLLPTLLQDVVLSEGEVVFLAARMLRERDDNVADRLQKYVGGALLTRLDAQREPRVPMRAQAAEALGFLGGRSVVPRLVAAAVEKVRGSQDDPKFEYSTVRLAAMLALRRITVPPYEKVAQHNEALAEILRRWVDEDVDALATYLLGDGDDVDAGVQSLAAFALGNLESSDAIDVLVEAFLAPDQDTSLYRNVSTALTLANPAEVIERVVLPLLEEADGDPTKVGTRLANLIYLIGRIRVAAKAAWDFLQCCLRECAPIHLKGLTIQSLGWLYAVAYKEDLEAIALGDFDPLRLAGPLSDGTRRYLQRKALEALVYVGDMETLEKLKQRAFTWDPDLELAFYRTSEEILAQGKRRVRNV